MKGIWLTGLELLCQLSQSILLHGYAFYTATFAKWNGCLALNRSGVPFSFKEKYPNTYILLDASEVFIQTPNDLHLQSSTWSNYKHHNTSKFLVGCTPNGAVSFVSQLYVGSISDVQLTSMSGLIDKLKGKPNISVMADRGFTIRDQLRAI